MEQYAKQRDEVLADFRAAVSEVDFSGYSPYSAEFDKALRIGLMWQLLGMAEAPESSDEISDEIDGAKRYMQKYIETGDMSFKEMSEDEMKHAGILIKKAYSRLPNGEEKTRLKAYENEIEALKKAMP